MSLLKSQGSIWKVGGTIVDMTNSFTEFLRIYETKFNNINNGIDTPIIGEPVGGYNKTGIYIEQINNENYVVSKNSSGEFGPTIDITGSKKIRFGARIYTKILNADGANFFVFSQNQQIIIIDPGFYPPSNPPRNYCIWGATTPRTVFLDGQADSNYNNYFEIPNKANLYNGGIFDLKIEIELTKNTDCYSVYINNDLFILGSGDFSNFTYLKFWIQSSRYMNELGFTNCFVDILK